MKTTPTSTHVYIHVGPDQEFKPRRTEDDDLNIQMGKYPAGGVLFITDAAFDRMVESVHALREEERALKEETTL